MNLESIWASYRGRLKAFLHAKISNSADVDDLLQDILIKVHGNIAQLRDASSVQAWLFQIANRAVIDFYRREGRVAAITGDASQHEEYSGEREHNIKAELAVCIEPFLRELPDEQAKLLRDIDLSGLSQKHYAERENISYSTLKSRVQKARQALKSLFDECCRYQMDQQGNLMAFEEKSNTCRAC